MSLPSSSAPIVQIEANYHDSNNLVQSPLDSCKKIEKRINSSRFFSGKYQVEMATGALSGTAFIFSFHSYSHQRDDTTYIEYILKMEPLSLLSRHQMITCYSLQSDYNYILLAITDINFEHNSHSYNFVLLSQPISISEIDLIKKVEFNGLSEDNAHFSLVLGFGGLPGTDTEENYVAQQCQSHTVSPLRVTYLNNRRAETFKINEICSSYNWLGVFTPRLINSITLQCRDSISGGCFCYRVTGNNNLFYHEYLTSPSSHALANTPVAGFAPTALQRDLGLKAYLKSLGLSSDY